MIEPKASSARCFASVDDGLGHPVSCHGPVRWHGFVRSAAGGIYRVLACETHASTLGHRTRVTRRLPTDGLPGGRAVVSI